MAEITENVIGNINTIENETEVGLQSSSSPFCQTFYFEDYYDDKAEVYYKNNFDNSISNNEEKEQIDRHNSESLSSLDNITDNKIIFTKKTKKIIDKNLDPNCGTLTLTSNSINNINNLRCKIN